MQQEEQFKTDSSLGSTTEGELKTHMCSQEEQPSFFKSDNTEYFMMKTSRCSYKQRNSRGRTFRGTEDTKTASGYLISLEGLLVKLSVCFSHNERHG